MNVRVEFPSRQVTGYIEDGTIVLTVEGPDGSGVILQRLCDEPFLAQLHLEYGSQAASGYGLVSGCRISRSMFSIDLGAKLPKHPEVQGFDVTLAIDDSSYSQAMGILLALFEPFATRLAVA